MSQQAADFDPSQQASGSFLSLISRPGSSLYVKNTSNFFLKINLGVDGIKILQPWYNQLYRNLDFLQTVYWSQDGQYSGNNPPASRVTVEEYDPEEYVSDAWNGPILGQVNVGNIVTNTSAANAFEQDLFTPWVYSAGLVATKDLVVANQLDVTAGVAFLKQTDSSIGRVAPNPITFLTTTPSATYFLDLNVDGSWSFATTHSAVPNYLPIAQVTTDGSANILTVTDVRPLNTTMLAAGIGLLLFGPSGLVFINLSTGDVTTHALTVQGALEALGGFYIAGGGSAASMPALSYNAGANLFDIWTPQSGSAQAITFLTWSGAASEHPLTLGDANPAGSPTWINGSGTFQEVAGQTAAGAFGVPVVSQLTRDTPVSSNATQSIATLTVPSGSTRMVRLWMEAWIGAGNTNNGTITMLAAITDPVFGSLSIFFNDPSNAAAAFNAVIRVKGNPFPTMVQQLEVSGGSTITLRYTNAAAGTISDKVSALIELLA